MFYSTNSISDKVLDKLIQSDCCFLEDFIKEVKELEEFEKKLENSKDVVLLTETKNRNSDPNNGERNLESQSQILIESFSSEENDDGKNPENNSSIKSIIHKLKTIEPMSPEVQLNIIKGDIHSPFNYAGKKRFFPKQKLVYISPSMNNITLNSNIASPCRFSLEGEPSNIYIYKVENLETIETSHKFLESVSKANEVKIIENKNKDFNFNRRFDLNQFTLNSKKSLKPNRLNFYDEKAEDKKSNGSFLINYKTAETINVQKPNNFIEKSERLNENNNQTTFPKLNNKIKKRLTKILEAPETVSNLNKTKVSSKKTMDMNELKLGAYKSLTMKDYEEMTFDQLIIYDKRSFFKYYFDTILEEHCILEIIFKRSLVYPKLFRTSLLFFSFSLDFALNAIFYSDSYISARHSTAVSTDIDVTSFAYTLEYELPKSLWSILISSVLTTGLHLIQRPIKEAEITLTEIIKIRNIDLINFA